jgi:hypothetical protein
MGCTSACQIFERFSTALEWIGKRHIPEGVIIHILDKFFIMTQTQELCKFYLNKCLEICANIEISMAPGKITLTFLGIDMDTEKQEARLPDEKLEKCFNLVEAFLHRKKVTLKKIQSRCGLLNFACQVIHPGQTFLRRLFELTRGWRDLTVA